MAREIVFTDDLTGEHGAEPVRIGWQDVWFEVDLAAPNRKKLTEFVEEYINAGRPAPSAAEPATRQRRARGTSEPTDKIDYSDSAYAGNPHRGRVNPAEAEYVRENLTLVNMRLKGEGLREIDPKDPKMAERYGL